MFSKNVTFFFCPTCQFRKATGLPSRPPVSVPLTFPRNPPASPTGNGAGNGAGSTTDHTDHSHLAVLQTQVKALEELADYHRAQLTEADRRQQMLLTNLHSAHQIIEALTRVLPAPEMALTTPKRPWAWLTWWKQKP